jgi:hypothetical protein
MTENLRLRHSPFRSLDFFTSAEAAIFSGREEEIEEVATRIVAGTTLVLYGPSGVGKTSLLCAGIVPTLENRRGYRVTYVRPLLSPRGDIWRAVGADPTEPLAAAIARLPALPLPDSSSSTLAVLTGRSKSPDTRSTLVGEVPSAQQATMCAPHVLILDQLEELFTRFDAVQRRPLWEGLVEVIEDPRAPVRLVLSLREEYLHLLDSAHPRLPNLLDRRFRLQGLTPFGARTAIIRPLIAEKVRYEPELVDRCVADLTEVPIGHSEDEGVIDPLLLQIVCSEVYREAEHRHPELPLLTLADYNDLGGPEGVFKLHFDELFKRVHAEDHLLLMLVLQEMTTAHATKLPTTLSRLSHSGLLPPREEIQDLLDKLVAASLVRRYDAEPEPWYELVHDRLVQALPEHFAHDQRFLRIRYMRELVSQLSKGLSEDSFGAPLLNRQQLTELVEPFCKYIRFNEQELCLLFRSAIAVEHNVVAWRDALEAVAPGKSLPTILATLLHADTRCGGLAAIELLRITEYQHLSHCLHLALTDNDPDVVTAASRALNAAGTPDQAAQLLVALKHRSLRPRALWVLAELADNPVFQLQASVRDLGFAQRERELRRFLSVWESIQRAGWEGLRIGFGSGALAAVASIGFWCIAMKWVGRSDATSCAAGGSMIAIMSIMLSLLCSHSMGRASVKLEAIDRKSTWINAIQLRDILKTFFILLALSACACALVLAAVIPATPATPPSLEPNISIAVIALWALSPAVILASVGLTELTLPIGLWQRGRTRVQITVRALLSSWIFSIGIGGMLASFSTGPSEKIDVVILATMLLGAWCSVCSTSIAAVFAESIWKRSRSRRLLQYNWLSVIPVVAFTMILVVIILNKW